MGRLVCSCTNTESHKMYMGLCVTACPTLETQLMLFAARWDLTDMCRGKLVATAGTFRNRLRS